jgi:hypothetical protein
VLAEAGIVTRPETVLADAGYFAERVVAAGLGGSPVAEQVRRHDPGCLPYRHSRGRAANPKGLPSESLHTAQRSPGWMTLPPSAWTRRSASARSSTSK